MTPDTRVALETLLALAKAWAVQAPNAELRVLIDRGKQAAERALAGTQARPPAKQEPLALDAEEPQP